MENQKEIKGQLVVSAEDLALVEQNTLNPKQMQLLLKKTPDKYVRERPAKGGGKWKYVSGGYVKKVLNIMFGWDWDFEIMEQMILHDEAIVKGKLTVRTNGKQVVKTQFGNKDVVYKKEKDEAGNRVPLSIGNDLKAAATDALKKCASELGIASDVYNAQEFQSVEITISQDESINKLRAMSKRENAELTDEEKEWKQQINNITTEDEMTLYLESATAVRLGNMAHAEMIMIKKNELKLA